MIMMADSSSSSVLVDVNDAGVALLTLNDESRRNAVTPRMRDELVQIFAELESRPEVRAVVVTGAGQSFCAGADLGELATASGDDLRNIYDAFLAFANSPLPTIAAVNGHAVGAGLNLALACDIRLASPAASFAAGFLRLGLHPGGGSTWMLRRTVGPQVTAAMMLFGKPLDGHAAARVGLVLECVDGDLLVPEAIALAEHVVRAPAPLVERLKRTLRQFDGVDALADAVDLELEAQAWSTQQDFFRERIASVGARVGGNSSP